MTFEGHALPERLRIPDAPKNALYTVTDLYPEHIVLDGNHPLAGIALRLSLKVEAVREATEEEIGRGSAGTGFFQVPTAPPQTPPCTEFQARLAVSHHGTAMSSYQR
jgi:FKBP-type peptidyl-prolyl cis-trans isomerase SlyD